MGTRTTGWILRGAILIVFGVACSGLLAVDAVGQWGKKPDPVDQSEVLKKKKINPGKGWGGKLPPRYVKKRPQKDMPRKVNAAIAELVNQRDRYGSIAARRFAREQLITYKNDHVMVMLEPEKGRVSDSIDIEKLKALGGRVVGKSKHSLRAEIPPSLISSIANKVRGISRIVPAQTARSFASQTRRRTRGATSEGVALVGCAWYHQSGWYGQGARVVILDLSFGGLDEGIRARELPNGAIRKDFTGLGIDLDGTDQYGKPIQASAHGTACAEIAYEMAPGARFWLVRFLYEDQFEDAKDYAVSIGAHIVSNSTGYIGGYKPDDGSSPMSVVVDAADAAGLLWVNAAGNDGDNHYFGTFTDTDDDGWHEFAPGIETLDVNLSFRSKAVPGMSWYDMTYTLRWDDLPTTTQNLDLYVYGTDWNGTSKSTVKLSGVDQTGSEPYEVVTYPVTYAGKHQVMVKRVSGSGPVNFHVWAPGRILANDPYHSIGPPADAAGSFTVGAIDEMEWTSGAPIYYSSRGPVLTTGDTTKPDIVAPTEVSNYMYGIFNGTSAACPHVAGAAALIKSRYPTYDNDAIRNILQVHALDAGIPGDDSAYGYGRLFLP